MKLVRIGLCLIAASFALTVLFACDSRPVSEFTGTPGGMTYCTPESASGKTECVIFDLRSSDARRAECEADPSCVWIGTLETGETIVIDPFSRREPEPNPIEQREL